MSEVNKTIELKEEELQKVVGGVKGEKAPLGVYRCPNCNQICKFSPESFQYSTNAKCSNCNITTDISYYTYLGTEEDYLKNIGYR